MLLSTTTEHGHTFALQSFDGSVPVIYAPIDFIGSVKTALTQIRPEVMIFLETEIWPTWISEAKRIGCKTLLLNGRISERSIGQYMKFKFFFRTILEKMDFFSMISEEDAARIRSMGAQPHKIGINGNAKYDLLSDSASKDKEVEIRRLYNAHDNSPVIIAGSTRGGEEIKLLSAYKKILNRFPKSLLIIAPRHLNRIPEIEHLLKSHGFRYQLRSSLDGVTHRRQAQIVIVDKFGELFSLYSLGDINFCGASLVPLGGQNPLEAAIWGKVVFYGPHMEDFLDAKSLLESVGAGIMVDNEDILAQKAIWYLDNPEVLHSKGDRAKAAVLMNRHAASRHARAIIDFL
jgi:3-deoxy-D-manno-octulosonic-acid transferase